MKTLYISRINSGQPELTELKVRSVLNKHVFFQLRFVFCCLLFLGSFSAFSQSGEIDTDHKIYAPGDVVHISGSNFISGQTVNLVVSNVDQPGSEVYLTAVALNNGTFDDLLYTIPIDAGNTNFVVNDLLSLGTGAKAAGGGTSFASALGLSQGKNGGVGDTPISPIEWINGNSNGQKSHYIEGNSIPYRVILSNVTNGTHTLRIEFDIRHGGKNAIDFITSYNRSYTSGGIAETVDPTSGIPDGIFDDLPNMFDIPTPNAAQVVNGKPQPQTAFLALKAKPADVQFAAFNAVITDIQYISQGDITADNSKTQIEITYNVTNGSEYVMFAWSGHIADRRDWGPGSSCASINGSPYHTNMLSTSDFVGGAEDRALSTDAVQFFPTCDISIPEPGCVGDTLSVTATTDAPSPQFDWSVNNGAVIIGSGATVDVAFPGSGSYEVSVTIVDFFDGQVISESTTCFDTLIINESPNAEIAVDDHPDCLDSIGTYHVESGDGFTYQWSVSGDAVIDGSSTSSSVNVDVDDLCSPAFQLTVIVNNNGCISYDTLNYDYSDEIAPVIGAAGDDEVVLCDEEYDFDPPSATDNCDDSPAIHQLDDDIQAGDCAAESVITRGWYFEDNCGNKSDTVYQSISIVDTIAPVIGAAGDDEVVLCTEEYAFDPPSATDNCDENPAIHQLDDDIQAGDCAAESTITRGWYFEDACGNISDTVYQTISIVDTIAPVIGAAGDDEVVLCTEEYAFDAPSATDNCDENPAIHQLDDDIQAGNCPAESVITRGWYFEDACGNVSDTVYQTISIVDTIAPVIGAAGDNEVVLCTEEYAFDPPSATDNCDENPAIHQLDDDIQAGVCAAESMITRGWYFTDACGNVSDTVYQTISIVDTIAPEITAAGSNEIVLCTAEYSFDPPTATDNCDEQPLIHQLEDDVQAGECEAESMITRGWYFTDECLNHSDTVYQTISIVDTIAPLLSEPEDMAIECDEEPEFTAPTPTDDCSIVDLQSEGPDTTFVNGEMVLTMTWTAIDACGNESASVDQAITIHACPEIFCSLTQGFYGNAKGVACASGERGRDLMIRLLSAPYGSLVVGSNGRTLTINAADVDCLIGDMPAGGPASPLALGNNSYGANCVLPAVFTAPKSGKFRNVLLGQVITLGLNLRLDAELGGLQLEGTQMTTYGGEAGDDGLCGTDDDIINTEDVRIRTIPSSVLAALDAEYAGDRSVANLFLLANRLLGGETISGVSLSQINQAVSAINEGFDGCRFLGGFGSAKSEESNDIIELVTGKELNYKVFPNPFSLSTTIEFVTSESMDVKIDLYSIKGELIATLYDDIAEGNVQNRVILDGSMLQNGMYFCRIYTKNEVYETRIILNK